MSKYDWIIGIANTEADGVRLIHLKGTVEQVKKNPYGTYWQDRCDDEEKFVNGTSDISDIEEITPFDEKEVTEFNAYHIDYTAARFDVMQYHEM